ncbi:MAG TPA: universal stress protein, partial [Thalassobaculum sp.]
MTFRNLLVHLDPSKSSLKRADVAIGLAAAHGAHLTALAAVPAPLMPSYATAEIPTSIYDRIATSLDDELRAAAAAFVARAEAAGIAYEVRREVSREPIADLIGRHARYSDLAILGQPDPDDPLSGAPEVAEDVILGGGRPVLMVPYI